MPLQSAKKQKRYQPKPMAIRYADTKNEQQYGTINKAMGNCHFTVDTVSGETKTASTCGVIKKRGKIRSGDFVLIEPLSEDIDKKYQIIFKYSPQQKKILEKEGHLKVISNVEEENKETVENDMFMFEGEEKEENNVVEDYESLIDGI